MVTVRLLPWLVSVMALSACGGSIDFSESGAGGSAGRPAEGGGASDPKGPVKPCAKCLPEDTTTGASGSSGDTGGTSDTGGGNGGSMVCPDVGEGGFGPGGSASQYPGTGFIVHEWGTDTIVVGSDGSLQRGLHHEEEDLPAFVYDRLKAGASIGADNPASPSVTIKMETPVTYFYSDKPLNVRAKVSFPQGVLTQWYPGVKSFLPAIAAPFAASAGLPLGYGDPALDPAFPFASEMCRARWSTVQGGLLDWGEISVLAHGTDVSAMAPAAPLAKFSWSYARAVDSNPVLLPDGEAEKFLFYRGLGDFDLPVQVTAAAGGKLTLANQFSQAMGTVFAINVDADRGAFTAHPEGIAPGGKLATAVPSLGCGEGLDQYQARLGEQVTAALDATGLYHDEALAMVSTWKRQWFRTPGARLLYIIPQLWTDSSIPLTIEPKPDAMLRVMLIRVEVITPEQEAEDVAALAGGGFDEAHFAALGRFAEPRLRRGLDLQYSKGGLIYLSKIATASTRVSSGE